MSVGPHEAAQRKALKVVKKTLDAKEIKWLRFALSYGMPRKSIETRLGVGPDVLRDLIKEHGR
jgi:hypothetical protein